MDLHLTLIDPQRLAGTIDVVVAASPGTPFSAVTAQLADALAVTAGPDRAAQFHCGRRPLRGSDQLGRPPLLQGAILTLRRPHAGHGVPEPPLPADPLLEAHVTAGPDAGSVYPLPLGRHAIGRSSSCTVRLDDLDVSRNHAELVVEADAVQVRDTGSRNGTWLDGQQIGRETVAFSREGELRIGSNRVALRVPDRPPAAVTQDGEGHLKISCSPHLRPARGRHEIHFPVPPAERTPARLPWPVLVLPLLLAVPMALLWHQLSFVLFALLTPVLMIGQFLADRRSGARDQRQRQSAHQAAHEHSQRLLDAAISADADYLEAAAPDLARLAVTARTPTDELWRRSNPGADFLMLRLGRGSAPSTVVVHRPTALTAAAGGGSHPGTVTHHDVPVTVNLCETVVLGICGPREAGLGLVRSLIGQICVLHSPAAVRVSLLTAEPGDRPDWSWLTRLPHHDPATPVPPLISRLDGGPPVRRILVLDGAHRLAERPETGAILQDAHPVAAFPGAGAAQPGREPVLLICLDQAEQQLPSACRTVVILDSESAPAGSDGTALLRRDQVAAARFTADLAGLPWTERLSRWLAPLRDAAPEPGGALPSAVRLLDLLREAGQRHETLDLAARWRRDQARHPIALLGRSADGQFQVDLRRDGPHLLIGGTTGAGKSELLQTLVASLAVGSPPDAISFLLIDYKGGAAFRECAPLPHVAAVITDLDQQLARRALASLKAELRRRERLLHSAGAVDLEAYAAARFRRPDLPAVPRLVIIVDEFRVLAEELPDFVGGLIRTATVGRSLGVHLVLATQRPAGVVSPEITANVTMRIALRVRDGADSRDLIDDPAAAGIPVDLPGRAFARSGAGPLTAFQTARVTGRAPSSRNTLPAVRRLNPAGELTISRSPVPTESASAGKEQGAEDVSDLAVIAEAAWRAVGQLDLAPAAAPWLPPLPELLRLGELDALVTRRAEVGLAFGLIDLPAEQRQEPLVWRLDGSHLAVTGGPRSGRSTALTTIAQAAAALPSDQPLHVYLIDGTGILAGLRGLPNIEAVLAVQDVERAERLLQRLAGEIESRQRSPQPAYPRADVVLLVDGWEALTSAWAEVSHGRMLDQLISVLRDGPAVGVHAAISGGRTLLTGAVSSLLAERLVLRFADPADAMLAGVPARRLAGAQPAGRGVFLAPDRARPVDVQIALAAADVQVAVAAAPIEVGELRPTGDDRSERPGWRISELPPRLTYQQLTTWAEPSPNRVSRALTSDVRRRPAHLAGTRHRRVVPVGVGGDDAAPVLLDLDAGPVTLVIGPPGSGRTSTLGCLAAGLSLLGEPAVLVTLTGAGRLAAGGRGMTGSADLDAGPLIVAAREVDGAARISAVLQERPDTIVLVDDVPSADPRAGESAVELVGELLAAHAGSTSDPAGSHPTSSHPTGSHLTADRGPSGKAPGAREPRAGRLVIACTAAEVLTAYRGLLTVARTARSGLLLGQPAPGDAEVFGLRLGSRPPGPPGRALLIQPGESRSGGTGTGGNRGGGGGSTVSTVQLALPPTWASEAGVDLSAEEAGDGWYRQPQGSAGGRHANRPADIDLDWRYVAAGSSLHRSWPAPRGDPMTGYEP